MNTWYLFVFVLGHWTLIGECSSLDLCASAAKSHHEQAVKWMEREQFDVRTDAVCKSEMKLPRMLHSKPGQKVRVGEPVQMIDLWPDVYTDLRGIGREACPRPTGMTIGEITPLYQPSKRGSTVVTGQRLNEIWFSTVWNQEYGPRRK